MKEKRRGYCAVIASLVTGVFWGTALANPVGPQVVSGQANILTQGNTLTVTNTPGAIINWQGFSNRADEITRFVQQSGTSSVLNRVTGRDPSTILGQLQSNGRVFLINPNGILFGPGAKIDVNGLVASTLSLADDDFLAGRFNFLAGPFAEGVRNQGTITTPSGGKVWLIAPQVENSGIITAPNGDVLLAAGYSVNLVDSASPDIAVVVSAPEDRALNLGQIAARSGKIGIYGGLLSQKGTVSADSAVAGENGRIFFRASQSAALEAGSITTANGAAGGDITVRSDSGDTLVAGAVSATGSTGNGGAVSLLGARVSLSGNAVVDGSGTTGGGTVLVGGDFRGENPAVQNARATHLGEDVSVKADATGKGDGGKIIVWSDGSTTSHGALSARGGSEGGNGGLIETSGHYLDVDGKRISAAAPRGAGGTWLLDPYNIVIDATSANSTFSSGNPVPGTDTIFPNTTASQINSIDINSRLDSGTSVIVTTSGGGGAEAGNISVNAPITKVAGSDASLTLKADGSVFLNNSIGNFSTTGRLDVNLEAANGNIVFNQGGIVGINVSGGSIPGIVTLNAPNGSINGQATAVQDIFAAILSITSGSGVGTAGGHALETGVNELSVTNGSSGGIDVANSGPLTVTGVTQNASAGVVIASNGNLMLNAPIIAAGGGVVSLRASNGAILDGNGPGDNITGAFRVDFNDGATPGPQGVGTSTDPIEVSGIDAGGIMAQTTGGGIFLNNTGGSFLNIGGIVHSGPLGDIKVTSNVPTTITGGILSSSAANASNITVDVAGAPLTLDTTINKAGPGNIFLGGSSIAVKARIFGSSSAITLQSPGDIDFINTCTVGGPCNMDGSVANISAGGHIFGGSDYLFNIFGPANLTAGSLGDIDLGNAANALSGTVTVNGGRNVVLATSGTLTLGNAAHTGVLSATSTSGAVRGTGTIGGSQLNVTAASGIDFTAVNMTPVINLVNITGGSINYLGSAPSLAVTASSTAVGGSLTVKNTLGNLQVAAGGIVSSGPVFLSSQKVDGLLSLNGPVDTRPKGGAGSFVNLSADNMALAAPVFGDAVVLAGSSPGLPIALGGADAAGILGLTGPELSPITANITRIGNSGSGPIVVSGGVAFPGALALVSGSSITQNPGQTIGATSLRLSGTSVFLPESNQAGVISGNASSGDFIYHSVNPLAVSFVDSVNGISSAGNVKLISDMSIGQAGGMIQAGGGGLALQAPGDVFINNPSNSFTTVAADLDLGGSGYGMLNIDNDINPLTIGTVFGIDGIQTNGKPVLLINDSDIKVASPINTGMGKVELDAARIDLAGGAIRADHILLQAYDPAGGITSGGTVTSVVEAGTGIMLVADKMAFSLAPAFSVTGTFGAVSLRSYSDDLPITLGSVCSVPGCLLLGDVSSSTFSSPVLSIGSDLDSDLHTAGPIDIATPVARFGTLALLSGGAITQSSGAEIATQALAVSGTSVYLPEPNPTGVVAGNAASGEFHYRSKNLLTPSMVGPMSGISAAGNIRLESDSVFGINQNGGAGIRTSGGLALRTPGPVMLTDGSNDVGVLAADLSLNGTGSGEFVFRNAGRMAIGDVATSVSGVSQTLSGIKTNNGNIDVTSGGVTPDGLSVGSSVLAGSGAIHLAGPNVFLRSNSLIEGRAVSLIAFDGSGSGKVSFSGPTAPRVNALKDIILEADNLEFGITPILTVDPSFLQNEISISAYSPNRPITIGSACNGGVPCLLLSDISGTTFNTPTLVIGTETLLEAPSDPAAAGTGSTAPYPSTTSSTGYLPAGPMYPGATAGGSIFIDAPVVRSGRLALLTDNSITQTASITVPDLGIVARGKVTLDRPNTVNSLAALVGDLSFNDSRSLDIVSVKGGVENPVIIEGVSSKGGTISLTTAGDLTLLSAIDAGTGTVSLNAAKGAIIDSADRLRFPDSVIADSVSLNAANGIGGASGTGSLSTRTANISASNSTANSINIANTGALIIGSIANGGVGDVNLDNKGAVISGAGSITSGGGVSLTARSPLTIGTGGISAANAVTLVASATGGSDDMLVSGRVVSATGTITASAGGTIAGKTNFVAGRIITTENINSGTPVTSDSATPPPSVPDPPPPSVPEPPPAKTVQPVIDQVTNDANKTLPAIQPEVRVLLAEAPAVTTDGEQSAQPAVSGGTIPESTTATAAEPVQQETTSSGEPPANAEEEGKKKDADKKQESASEGDKKHAPVKKKQYCN